MAPATAKAETGDPVQAQAVRGHICLIKESGFYSVETPWNLFKQESNVLQRQAVAEMGRTGWGSPRVRLHWSFRAHVAWRGGQ